MKNKKKARTLAFLAGSASAVAFVLYNAKSIKGTGNPNLSSWAVWAFLTILNFTSYKKLTRDWVKSLLPTANAAMCILTALLALRTGSFQKLDEINQICLAIGLDAGLVWWLLKKNKYAESVVQVILQAAIVVGFIPTLQGTWRNPATEPWLPWLLWVASFILQYLAVRVDWGGRKLEFLYPVNMIIFHAVVFTLALR